MGNKTHHGHGHICFEDYLQTQGHRPPDIILSCTCDEKAHVKQGAPLSRYCPVIGFFADHFLHIYRSISHQTQSLHLSNAIVQCLCKMILFSLPCGRISGLSAHDGCEIKRNCSAIPVPQVSWWVNLFLTVDNVLLFLRKYHRTVPIDN